jgi:flagella basal body P-ring formation protein FlgA
MQIKTMARALQDGSFGDMIRLVNIRSGKTVQGKVNAVGSVVVTF